MGLMRYMDRMKANGRGRSMAVFHKSGNGAGRKLRQARMLMILCWPCAIAAALLTVAFYLECGAMLAELADVAREKVAGSVTAPAEVQTWMDQLSALWAMILQGVGWLAFALVVAAPGLIGLATAVLMICLYRPCVRRYGMYRMRVKGEKSARALLKQLPDACHVFLNKRIAFDGAAMEIDALIVGPGGVAAADVKNWSGLIEGNVTETMLYRRRKDGTVDKLRNPARKVVGDVMRLSAFLKSAQVNAGIVPCVLFVNPEASVYVTAPEEAVISERRVRVTSCVMTDTDSFWELLGRELACGQHLNRATVDKAVAALKKAPGGKASRT